MFMTETVALGVALFSTSGKRVWREKVFQSSETGQKLLKSSKETHICEPFLKVFQYTFNAHFMHFQETLVSLQSYLSIP